MCFFSQHRFAQCEMLYTSNKVQLTWFLYCQSALSYDLPRCPQCPTAATSELV